MGQGDTGGAVAVDGAHIPRDGGVARDRRRLWVISLGGGLLVAVLLGLRNAVDVDVWLHLRIGDELRSGTRFGQLPDPLVLLADRPYLPTQWLGQVVQSMVYERMGFAGIHALRVVGLFLLIVFVYLTSQRFVSPVPGAGITLVAVLATSGAWGERPQMAGLVLASAVILLWSRAWTRRLTPWWVVPLIWLWACVHGTWILGVGIGLLFTLAILWGHTATRGQWKGLALVNGLSLVVVALTPLGPELLVAPFTVSASARAAVAEWQVPSWTNPLLLLVLAMVVVAIPGAARRSGPRLGLLQVLASVLLAASAVRTIAFGALLAAPACAASLRWLTDRKDRARAANGGVSAWMAVAVVLMLTGSAVLDPPKTSPLEANVATALAKLEPGARVAVSRPLSNWVLYRYPGLVPLQDLRAEVYSEEVAAAYTSFMRAEDGWEDYAMNHDIRAIVVDGDSELAKALQSVPAWLNVASEGAYEMWVLNSSGRT